MPTSHETWWERDQQVATEEGTSEHEEALARMPSLGKPLAAFGAAAGLFAILALGSFREPAREVSPLVPMVTTALFGALAGAALRRWRRLHDPRLAREYVVAHVAMITLLAGAASGGTVGLLTWGLDGFARFAGGGALVALLFLPSCLVVFEAARRAGRGRHGSLVASTDRRTVLSTALAGIAFAGATQVPALLSAEVSSELEPVVQASLSIVACLGAAIAIVALERRDRQARASLEAFGNDAAWLDRTENDEALPASAVDLGIGAEHWARTTDANYRLSGRSEVLFKGSIADARSAFEECTRRRHRSLIMAACSLTAVSLSFALRLSVLL
jgi:hypothetical protein